MGGDQRLRCECGSTEFEQDLAAGTTCCIQCGIVLEENVITSEITFTEGPGGAMRMDGQFINNDASGPAAMGSHGRRMNTGLSREQTISHARERLRRLSAAIGGLTEQHLEHALRVFKLALHVNFTKGRRSEVVAGACLYIACRDSGTKHLLIDFSDTLQVSVFILGGTFSKLVKTLGLPVNYVDPSAYIERFAARMDLGDKKRAVADDATRLLARMHRDWIVAGRRPNGLCGACLLIASRMHGFKRTEQEIMIIVKIGEQTIKNRLSEFAKTSAAQITVTDFRQHKEEAATDSLPPSFMRLRQQESLSSTITDAELQREVNEKLKILSPQLDEEPNGAGPPSRPTIATNESVTQAVTATATNAERSPLSEVSHSAAANAGSSSSLGSQPPLLGRPPGVPLSEAHLLLSKDKHGGHVEAAVPMSDNLSDLDDEELEAMLLDEEEVEKKTAAWEKENQLFFEMQEAKRKQKEQHDRPKRTHNRAFHFTSQRPGPTTTVEAVELVLQNKAPMHSKKLNLDAMKHFEQEEQNTSRNKATGELARGEKGDLKTAKAEHADGDDDVVVETDATAKPSRLRPGRRLSISGLGGSSGGGSSGGGGGSLLLHGKRKPLLGGLRSTFTPRIRGAMGKIESTPMHFTMSSSSTTSSPSAGGGTASLSSSAASRARHLQAPTIIEKERSSAHGPRHNYLKQIIGQSTPLGGAAAAAAADEEEVIIEEHGHIHDHLSSKKRIPGDPDANDAGANDDEEEDEMDADHLDEDEELEEEVFTEDEEEPLYEEYEAD